MNKLKLLALFALFCAQSALAQITYEPGYYIDGNGTRISGLIRNIGWKNNPRSIDFKTDETADPVTLHTKDIREFGLGDVYRFKKFELDVDQSPMALDNLSDVRNPIWKKETVMVKFLASGKRNLFLYEEGNTVRFLFSSSDEATPEQLVFKEYRSDASTIEQNGYFRQQLFVSMSDTGIPVTTFEKLRYKEDDLVKLFATYNGPDEKAVDYSKKSVKSKWKLKVLAGVMVPKVWYADDYNSIDSDFKSRITPAIGLETECLLPFNQNKWSLFAGANYQGYKSDGELAGEPIEVEYSYIEVPLGMRFYMFLSPKCKLFVNAGYVLAFDLGGEIVRGGDRVQEISNASGLLFGGGVMYKKFALEARYNAPRALLNYALQSAAIESFGLVASYEIF